MDVTHLRRILALLAVASAAALAGPAGCGIFTPPEPPKLEIPAPPEPPKPPDVKPPEAPKLQNPIDPMNAGNCCFRNVQAVDRCNGANRCCSAEFELDACEAKGGFWFYDTADCAGAC